MAKAAGEAAPSPQAEDAGADGPVLVDKVLTPRPMPGREDSSRPPRQVDLSVIVRRARWKAAACRLAVDRRAAEEGDAGIARLEENLRRQRADLEDCWAWMLDSPRNQPEDRLLLDVAACYDTVALAAESVEHLQERGALDPKPPAELLYLLAESQSALLSALHKCDLRGDSDQRDLFLWLKDQTTRHRIYVDRHMRLDDPADSSGSEELGDRLKTLVVRRVKNLEQGRLRGQLLNKVRYHVQKADGRATEPDQRAIEVACAEWIKAGLDAKDAELVGLVAEVMSSEDGGAAVAEVLGESTDGAPTERRRDILVESRALLETRRVLMIGVADQADDAHALVEPLGLAALRFVSIPSNVEGMPLIEPELDRPDVDLVLIAYRLPAEDYASFKTLCMEKERPFVRLPGGLAAEQVGHQVLRQVAWRLRQEAPKA